jgi:hypothetical protein
VDVNAERLEDRLGPDEPPYRSRGEAQVGRLLDRYGIPFFYEMPAVVFDRRRHRTWHPDFTLPYQNGLIVEYAGMPDVAEYMRGIRHKERVYGQNGLPAVFLYPHDLHGPNWPERVYGKITHAAQNYADDGSYLLRFRRCPATSASTAHLPRGLSGRDAGSVGQMPPRVGVFRV